MDERDNCDNLVSLHNNLLKVWENQKVDQYYQNIILNYLDDLPEHVAKRKIIEQIKACHEGQSQYFQLNQKLNKRKRTLQALQQIIQSTTIQRNIQEQLPLICQMIEELRNFNLIISEILLNLHRTYTGNYRQVSDQFLQILLNLDRQNDFLKQSVLSNYIMFQHGYDPFFLYHYEIKKRQMPLKRNQQVDETFRLNISYAYRLYKTKAKILQMLGTGKMDNDSNMKKKVYYTLGNNEEEQYNHKQYSNRNDKFSQPLMKHKRRSLSLQQAKQNQKFKTSHYRQSFTNNFPSRKAIYNPALFKQAPYQFQDDHSQQSATQSIVLINKKSKLGRVSNNFIKKDGQLYQLIPIQNKSTQNKYENREQRPERLPQFNNFSNNLKEKLRPIKQQYHEEQIYNTQLNQSSSYNSPLFKKQKYFMGPQTSIKSQMGASKLLQRNFNIHKIQQKKYPETLSQYPEALQNSSKYQTIMNQFEYPHNKNHHNIQKHPYNNVSQSQKRQLMKDHSIRQNLLGLANNEQKDILNPNKQKIKQPINHQKSLKQSNNQIISEQQQILPSESQKNKISELNKLKLKIRPGKLSFDQLKDYIKSLNLSADLKNKVINESKWINSLSSSQSYIIQFIINDNISHFSIVHALPEGDYLIKLWGQMVDIGQDVNKHVFKKFIEYIEKNTTANLIHFIGQEIKQLKFQNFQPKQSKRFSRKRMTDKPNKQLQYPQFISIKCTNIFFSQQNQSTKMLYSEQIQAFTSNNYYIHQNLLQINKQKINKNLLLMMKVSQNIENMHILNKLLEDEDFDTFQVTSKTNISQISAIRFLIQTKIKSPFISCNGYLKYTSTQSFIADKKVICKLSCQSANSKIVLGKGFDNISAFILSCKKIMNQSSTFSVKMFSKQLYGRLIKQNSKCYYGNWQVSLSFVDQLHGRLKHEMQQNICFGPEEFYFGIQYQSQLILAFQVKKEDFLL